VALHTSGGGEVDMNMKKQWNDDLKEIAQKLEWGKKNLH
jgi:hypothetical protein